VFPSGDGRAATGVGRACLLAKPMPGCTRSGQTLILLAFAAPNNAVDGNVIRQGPAIDV
jgi:undecaprenyl pyrophosphate phosphatase UppP